MKSFENEHKQQACWCHGKNHKGMLRDIYDFVGSSWSSAPKNAISNGEACIGSFQSYTFQYHEILWKWTQTRSVLMPWKKIIKACFGISMTLLDLHGLLRPKTQSAMVKLAYEAFFYLPAPWNPLKMNTNTTRADAMEKIIKKMLRISMTLLDLHGLLRPKTQSAMVKLAYEAFFYLPAPWNPLKMNTNIKHSGAMEKMMNLLFHVSITLLDLHVAFCVQKDYHYQKAQSRWGKFPRMVKAFY